MLLVCSQNQYPEEALNTLLTSLTSISIFGGAFPALIHENEIYETGAILLGFRWKLDIYLYRDLTSNKIDIDRLFSLSETPLHEQHNLIMFIDGLSNVAEKFIKRLYESIGAGINIIGGGTGNAEFTHSPSIISNFGTLKDSALIAALPFSFHSSSGHGWEIIDGPYLATETEGQNLISIDYEPAFEAYREALFKTDGVCIDTENFFDISVRHPIGILDIQGELTVRDPFHTDGAQITFVGEIYPNSMLHLLSGDQQHLISAAYQSAQESLSHGSKYNLSICFDCLSRRLYLRDLYEEEVESLKQGVEKNHLIGALSLGEITTNPSHAFNWLNKSTVIGSF